MDRPVNNTGRFTGRAEAYTKYRYGYPPEALTLLADHFNLPRGAKIADVGSGTGILSAHILQALESHSVKVFGVEPNNDMRDAGESFMEASIKQGVFESVNGTAEETTLPDRSVDLSVAGAAFHWFDTSAFHTELLRYTKPSGSLAGNAQPLGAPFAMLTRHIRPDSAFKDPKTKELVDGFRETFSRYNPNYSAQRHQEKLDPEPLKKFFGHDQYKLQVYERTRKVTLQQIIGRMKSVSVAPAEGSESWEAFVSDVKAGFERFKDDEGMVETCDDLQMIYGYVQ